MPCLHRQAINRDLHMGIDVGSTTVKIAIIEETGRVIACRYDRHNADVPGALAKMLRSLSDEVGHSRFSVTFTGSAAMGLAAVMGYSFVQEVIAATTALRQLYPHADVAVELGGEDAKIIYLSDGLEQRMNGICAGGTGAFIDQMAALLDTDAAGLDRLASGHKTIYPVAARCGVFAKTDVQPLLNEGVPRADIAASILQAVVVQTISGLACGRPLRGTIVFLGGPLAFLPELRKRFVETLALPAEQAVLPADAELFVAIGAALAGERTERHGIAQLLSRLESTRTDESEEVDRLPPLFASENDLRIFRDRHRTGYVGASSPESYQGPLFLGLDVGSTTTKLVVAGGEGQILHSSYRSNAGNPLASALAALREMYSTLPEGVRLAQSAVTGYGEGLVKAALGVDVGEIETVAHIRAAEFFCPDVEAVLDIGGQDMKFMRVRDGHVESILLNEACSSGCGSFLDTFAAGLGLSPHEFAELALESHRPVDLGSRCTVFMNSRVKQAQKEGASVADIAAGLAYSVIKNALYKVIKLRDPAQLGRKIVVQGGTFHSEAVLRAFEQLSQTEALRPSIAGVMGAFGAALLAREGWSQGQVSTLIDSRAARDFAATTRTARCRMCANSCTLTVHSFPGGGQYVSGNRCERGAGIRDDRSGLPNLYRFKNERLFTYYEQVKPTLPVRGRVGLPRVLNMYENYPFWHTFFTHLGFEVVTSAPTSTELFELGMESIPSESVCYPAKLAHGHVADLAERDCDLIFYPSITYETKEQPAADNCFNCPIVISYPEVIRANLETVRNRAGVFMNPFLPYNNPARMVERLWEELSAWGLKRSQIKRAVRAAYREQENFQADIRRAGEKALAQIGRGEARGIILAGRPYHVDPGINHGIPELINSMGLAVLSEDSVAHLAEVPRPLRVVDQWAYHSRLYAAASLVCERDDVELVQLNSFGCGLDAITTDQVEEILRAEGRLYTCLKVDEGRNLGSARIRLRSLLATLKRFGPHQKDSSLLPYRRNKFTPEMKTDHTILVPEMSPMHFQFLEEAFRQSGYKLVILPSLDRKAVDEGLKYVNNDACFPSILVIGQLIEALKSGDYDIAATSVLISQTGGGCRATNYIGLLRKALKDAGFEQVPVISLSASGMEKNPGFRISPLLLHRSMMAVMYGDALMNVLYRVRPYEKFPGSANRLYSKWVAICRSSLAKASWRHYSSNMAAMIGDFEAVELRTMSKPRVGLVGEILVKYHPTANNRVVELVESLGAEAVMPGLMDFLLYCLYYYRFKHRVLDGSYSSYLLARLGIAVLELYRRPYRAALAGSRRFMPPKTIAEIAHGAEPILSLGHQTGEGWFLTGEMVELIESGAHNIICMQPFGCLPNHVTGKGMIRELRRNYPRANIVAVDYDPGASEVNQLNRIRLMLSNAFADLDRDIGEASANEDRQERQAGDAANNTDD